MQQAVLLNLLDRLVANGSWGGETHVQKAAYVLEALSDTEFGFEFILYKHGPFSFGLRDELALMRADSLLAVNVPEPRYGPRITISELGRQLMEALPLSESLTKSIDAVARELGGSGVMDLERLATATWVTQQAPAADQADRAQEVIQIKPHIDLADAKVAVERADQLAADLAAVRTGFA